MFVERGARKGWEIEGDRWRFFLILAPELMSAQMILAQIDQWLWGRGGRARENLRMYVTAKLLYPYLIIARRRSNYDSNQLSA